MKLIWHESAWTDYLDWQSHDKRALRRINELIKDTLRDPFFGIGKPEPLKHYGPNCWSRRIDDENRLVYRVTDGMLEIIECRAHYGKK